MLLYYVALLIFMAKITETAKSKWLARIDKYTQCPGMQALPIFYNDAVIKTSASLITIAVNITVKEDLAPNIENTWIIEKCANKESLDSCSPFYKVKTNHYCKLISSKGDWATFLDCINPRWQCPHKKGFYEAKNCSFDMSMLRVFPLQRAYWKCKIELRDIRSKQMVGCTFSAGFILPNRR